MSQTPVELAKRAIELDEKATKGPWDCHDMGPTLVERPMLKSIPVHGPHADAALIAEYRTICPTIARALIKAEKKLAIAIDALTVMNSDEWSDTPSGYMATADEALEEITSLDQEPPNGV